MDHSALTLAVGFLAQGFFSARILVQWILSEKAQRVLSPSLFWTLSLAGAYLLCLYGWLRNDFSIILGQFISFYIYVWNLNIKHVWERLPAMLRWAMLLTPITAGGFVAGNSAEFASRFLENADVPLWLLLFGSAGQLLFTLRFVYQWIYSRKRQASRLPAGFWIISLTGSLAIVCYGAIRHDIVLIVGQSFGVAAYIRNLVLIKKKTNKE